MTSHNPVRAVLMTAAVAATGAIAQAPQRPTTFRVNTQLVQVSVVVNGSDGKPVAGLTRDDFELYDNGQRQEIQVFRAEDYRPAGSSRPAAPAPAASISPSARVFSNRTPAEPGAPNAPTVIVIDAGNTWATDRMTWTDLVYARDQLIKFLRQVHREDRLGIYLMGSARFWILHEYTENCSDLLDRLASWKMTSAPEKAGAKATDVWTGFAIHFAGVDAKTAQAIHRSQFWGVDPSRSSALPEGLPEVHTGPTAQPDHGTPLQAENNDPLSVLKAVAYHLASVPGRKNVILVSGKTFLPTEFKGQVQVLRAILQTGVAIYAIDPGGLAPYALDATFVVPDTVTPKAAQGHADQAYQLRQQLNLYVQSSLTALAEDTGGRVFVNSNDVLGAIRSSFDDSRVTYTLGFYPSTSHNDGSFHRLKVKLPGHGHLAVRSRAGYFEPEPPSQDPHRREAELRRVIWSPVDASAIELGGSVSRVEGPDGWELKLNIGLAGVALQAVDNRWTGQIETILVQRDGVGNEYEPFSQSLGLKLKQDSYDEAVRSGLTYSRRFRLNPKATSLRVIVRDLNSENEGTLTIPVAAIAQ